MTSARGGAIPAVLLALALAAGAAPLAARNCSIAGNPVPNCGFDSDLSGGWYFTDDTVSWLGTDGAHAPGCVELDRADSVEVMEAFTGCFVVSPSTTYGVGGSGRRPSGTIDNGCYLTLIEYMDDTCGAGPSATSHLVSMSAGWTDFVRPITTLATTHSAQEQLACYSSTDFVVRLDDFFLARALLVDGFESGDTSAWSSVTP
jgi:hypothetical protein